MEIIFKVLSTESLDLSQKLRPQNPSRPPKARLTEGGKTQICKSKGFTMIELLIVLTILGIATTLVTTSYLGFEKRERVKSAALELKNQIRFAQNKALSGDKGFGSSSTESCPANSTLVGWYTNIDKNSNSYFIAGNCFNAGPPTSDTTFATKSTKPPDGVTIDDIVYYDGLNSAHVNSVNILYRPLENEAHFFNPTKNNPPFLNSSQVLDITKLFVKVNNQEIIRIILKGFNNTQYEVDVLPTGEVNEKKI